MANPRVIVDFVARTAGLQKGFSQAERSSSSFGKSLKGVGKVGALAAGAAGVGALVATVKIGIDEFAESSKVAAQTEAVLKSTGKAAGVTAKDVEDLATSLMKKSGVDDEAIASAENLLLTFTNVRNEAGKGNDIFNQTTQAALDMSVALGTDATTSAMQLGKALNDPEKGMTKLMKSGVTFTDAQKEQIKTLTESGKTMEAQKIILAELNKEFGGSAEAAGKTLPGQIAILKESFNNFAGDLVAKLVPAFERTIAFLRENWPQISATLKATWDAIKPIIDGLVALIVGVVTAIRDNWGTIGPIVQTVVDVIRPAAKLIGDVLKVVAALLRGDWSAAWGAFKSAVTNAIDLIKAAITLQLLPLKLLLTALWEGIKLAASTAWNLIKSAITTVVNAIKGVITTEFNAIKTVVTTVVNGIKTVIDGLKTAISTAGGAIGAALGKLADAFDKPADAAKTMLGVIKTAVGAIAGVISAVVGAVGRAAQAVADAMLKPINAAKDAINAVIGRFNALSIPGIPAFTVPLPGPLPDVKFGGWGGMDIPNIPELAKGGVVTRPTLAMIGERGPEAVIPLAAGGAAVNVRVFIGDQELRGLVRTEIDDSNTGLARTLLAGARA